jgi:hypothetical protein
VKCGLPIAHARDGDSQFEEDEEAQRNHRQEYQCKKQEETKGKGRCYKGKDRCKFSRKKGTRDKIPDSTKTKKRSAKCANNPSANSKKEPKANKDATVQW